jgi:hypothetical protein
VVRLDKGDKLIGYGEHPYIEEALRHADEDTAAGQRDYKKVYGKLYDHYYTGSASPSSDLDAWILRGRTFDVTHEAGQFVAILKSIEDTTIPKDMQERVKQTGKKETFTSRGYTYEITPCRFPNGEIGVSGRVLDTTLDKNKAWMWDALRTGRGATILEALTNGMTAEPKEV